MAEIINPEATRLTFTIDNRRPVELADLTLSLFALSDEYKRFVARQIGPAGAENARLYVSSLRNGSIVADLVQLASDMAPYGAMALPLLSDTNTVVQFGQGLATCFDFLLGRTSRPGHPYEKANLQNIEKIVEPVAKDPGSNLGFVVSGGIHFHGPTIVNYNLDSIQAKAAQNQAQREIQSLGLPTHDVYERVLMYWFQAKNDPKSNAVDRVVIEKISPFPIKVGIATPELKAQMITGNHNPFNVRYIVDVEVQTINGKPSYYTVLNVHDIFEDEPHPELF